MKTQNNSIMSFVCQLRNFLKDVKKASNVVGIATRLRTEPTVVRFLAAAIDSSLLQSIHTGTEPIQ